MREYSGMTLGLQYPVLIMNAAALITSPINIPVDKHPLLFILPLRVVNRLYYIIVWISILCHG